MSKCTLLAPLSLAALALGLATSLTACSDDRDTGGGSIRRKNPDATTTEETDSGTPINGGEDGGMNNTPPDSGMQSMCMNPACDPNELQGAPPACQCLGQCRAPYVFNAGTRRCELPAGTDGGTPNPTDGGTPNPTDGGTPPMNCSTAADCMGASAACVIDDAVLNAVVLCAGQVDCACVNTCEFDNPGAGCPVGERCAFAGGDSNLQGRGFCVPQRNGGQQGGSCDATFDPQGALTGHTCEVGLFCWGASEGDPRGQCGQLCNPGNQARCDALGNYDCDNLGDPAATVGLCLSPHPTYTDINESCMANNTCESNVCLGGSAGVEGQCTADCSNLNTCPNGSVCAGNPPNLPLSCFKDCDAGGSPVCKANNQGTSCYRFGLGFALCLPNCTADTDCPSATPTCNVGTGECS